MKTIQEILKDLGLTENEAKVFLGAVKAGLAPVSQIARQAKIARTYVYELAEELKKNGLLAETEEGGVKKVQALDYGGLLSYVGRRQREMQSLQKELEKAEGEFNALRSGLPQKTKVRFFDGKEGVDNITAEVRRDLGKLKNPYQLYVVFSVDRTEAVSPGWTEENRHTYFEPFMKKFCIINDTPLLAKFLEKSKHQKNMFNKIWPKELGEFPTDTLCWQNKIAYLDMKDHPSGIIIESTAIVQTFVMWFKQMWGSLK